MLFGYRGPGIVQILMVYVLGLIAVVLAFAFLIGLIKALLPWICLAVAVGLGIRWWLHWTQPW